MGLGPGDKQKLKKMSKAANKRFNRDYRKGFKSNKTKGFERGFRFVSGRSGNYKVRGNFRSTDSNGGAVSIIHPRNSKRKITSAGDGHTHVVGSNDYGKGKVETRVSFSGEDIVDFGEGNLNNGFVSMIEIGTNRHALVLEDAEKAAEFIEQAGGVDGLNESINNLILENYSPGMDLGEVTTNAVATVLGDSKDSGISFYVSTDKEKVEFELYKSK